MLKKLVIIGFLGAFGVALFSYFNKERRETTAAVSLDISQPRVILEDFVLYRYSGTTPWSKITARLGHLLEPNRAELYGEVKGERLGQNGSEVVTSESAIAYFNSASLSGLMETTELDRAELRGFVEADFGDYKLKTDYAQFLAKDNQVLSNRPVVMTTEKRKIKGEAGFQYDLVTQELSLFGKVEGTVESVQERRASGG